MDIILRIEYEREFESLDLPIKDNSEFNIVGIRPRRKDRDYIIQGVDEENTGTKTSVTVSQDGINRSLDEFQTDFLIQDIEKTTEFIEEEL